MALNKAKFQATASKLFAKAKAGSLTWSCTFELLGSYSPSTGQSASVTETIDCIREEYRASQKDGTIIQRNDFKLMAEFDSFSALTPRTDGVTVTINGKKCVIVDADLDAAEAVYTLQVRGS